MRKYLKPLLVFASFWISLALPAQTTRTVCASGCDHTSIQAAIDASTAGDNIAMQDAVHTENSIIINKNINICGSGSGTIVQATNNPGTGNFRIFTINSGVAAAINDLTLQNGNLQNTGTGGAILNEGDLILVNCLLTSNHAHRGGAIASTGQLGIVDCTISNNSVSDQGMNRASGAGIYAGGICVLTNSTVSGNTNNTGGAGEGGGLTIRAGSSLILIHATIANNSISNTGNGAGVATQGGSLLQFANSIIADNVGAEDLYNLGVIVTSTTNIIPNCAGICLGFITDDPVLLPLTDNGGCTPTHNLGPASAAIDAAMPYDPAVTVDQRGAERSELEPDIGAVEFAAIAPSCVTSLLCDGILPVVYLSFKAEAAGSSVQLEWETTLEVNNQGFEIERSLDGIRWESLGFVPGSGSTTAVSRYQFLDQSPRDGINYYRLKQIDYDGQSEYSPLRSVLVGQLAGKSFRVFPNPASTSFTLQLPDMERTYEMTMINSLGQILRRKSLGSGDQRNHRIVVPELEPGVYWLYLSASGTSTENLRPMRLVITPQ